MKALPLWQPYATLVATGAKKVETRAYPPRRIGLREGQRIAIHACKTQRDLWVCAEEFFIDHVHVPAQLPLGALVATCTLGHARQITEDNARRLFMSDPQEHAFGNYQPGRWAWVLTDVQYLEPISWTGSQGTFDVPDDLSDAGAGQLKDPQLAMEVS